MPYENLEIQTPAPVLSWANHPLTPDETKMAKNVASLPFVFKHVALMPDVHLGKGALVGSVIATKEAIIPAAVGVDIGCFVGETLIPLVDGKSYSIKQLAEINQEIIVYACTPTGKIVAAKATAQLTRKNASLVKVILDNKEEIICTPDHQFMLRDGNYQEAQLLQPGTSLMPFYSKTDKDGYTLISQPYSGRWQKAHWIIARSGLMGKIPKFVGQRTVIHHRNFNESDNRPVNLEFIGNHDHSAYHRSLVENNQHWQSFEFEEKRIAALRAKAQTPEGYKYYAERGTKNILQYMEQQPEHFKNAVAGNGIRGKQHLITYNKSQKGRAKSQEIANRIYTCEICGAEVKTPIGLHNHRQKEHKCNHKVLAVIPLDYTEDVYCLTVPEYHNFALTSGVFVHNCGMSAIKLPFSGDKLEGKLKKIRLDIEAAIPTGFNENKEIEKVVTNWQGWYDFQNLHPGVQDLETKAMKQLGSLGGGNHFIEVCLDTENQIWLMLHSGSRNIGNTLAQCHISTAKELAKMADNRLPDADLAYFVANTPEFQAYWHDLQWAQNYARYNRDVMMARFKHIIEKHLAGGKSTKPLLQVNCHHNYAEKEVHFGEEVYVTRKGAVRAEKEDYGIIPGSMGAKSFIVKGKGNTHSFCSCFPAGTKILTEFGLMNIEDVFNSSQPIRLISYNQENQKFEPKNILEQSERLALVHKYSLSQTRRRLENIITCTPDHPFATYEQGLLTYKSISEITSLSGGAIVPTQVNIRSNLTWEEQDTNFYYLLGVIISDGSIHIKERKNLSAGKVKEAITNLPNILLGNPFLALYFLAGYLDGNGTFNKNTASISIGKKTMFSIIISTLLSLGVAYKVYRNRQNYVIEFRDINILNKLREICQRLVINELPEKCLTDKFLLAQSLIGGSLKCDNLSSLAKVGKMINVAKFAGQSLDTTLAMNRIFKVEGEEYLPVYNFTVEDNHNYIVFTEYYTPILVHNCSHGAGRLLSRAKAKNVYTLDDLIEQTKGIECRKDPGVLDEIPAAYKPIEQVMENQSDLVEVVATLKQVVCVKG